PSSTREGRSSPAGCVRSEERPMAEPQRAFAALLLEKGKATWADLELCIETQVLYGGDLPTTLVDVGVLEEAELCTLYAQHLGVPAGPVGKLVDPSPHVSGL